MTLISLIVVLLAERTAILSKYWQADYYLSGYHNILEKRSVLSAQSSDWAYLSAIILPALLLYLVLASVDSALIRLVLDTAILLVCIGCPSLRATYKQYLQAANRGDFQACSLYADQLGHSGDSPGSFGQMLVWLNYQHYAAVIIWFALLGPAGAVLYVLARDAAERSTDDTQDTQDSRTASQQLVAILDWLPVRITALGLLLVGHFSRALPVWLSHFADLNTPAKQVLCDVARAAEEIDPDDSDCTEEPCTLVRLAKRNVMFLVVLISVLSLSGWLR